MREAMRERAGKSPRIFVIAMVCALVWAGAVAARGASQTPRVTPRLVQVNVIALDRHGNPVKGLTRSDFKVFDDGKPQKIAIFRVESNQPPAVHLPSLPPDTFTNAAERAGSAPRSVTVILLDALDTRMASRIYLRRRVVKFLEQLQPNDYVALYALTNRLIVLQDFTSNSAALVEALRHYTGQSVSKTHSGEPQGSIGKMAPGGTGSAEAGSESARLGKWLHDIHRPEDEYFSEQPLRVTTDALVAIANHLSGLPGRKNLIWISAGFLIWSELQRVLGTNGFTVPEEFRRPVASAARALNNADLAIDPVYAGGLMLQPEILAVGRSNNSVEQNLTTMDELAQQTGGRAFYEVRDVRHSIRRVLDDSRVNYVLGYYPQDVKWKGELRKIKVKVDRRGVRLQYRRGYSALPQQKALPARDSRALGAVVNSPLDATGIGLAVQVLPDKGASTAGGPAYRMQLQIDPKDITFERRGSLRVADLTLVTGEFGPQGQNLKGVAQKVNIRLGPASYQKALAEGVRLGERLPIPVLFSADRLHVVIRDNATGRLGSVNLPLNRSFRPARPFFTKRIPGG